jgi:hypothetical protein
MNPFCALHSAFRIRMALPDFPRWRAVPFEFIRHEGFAHFSGTERLNSRAIPSAAGLIESPRGFKLRTPSFAASLAPRRCGGCWTLD